MKQQVKKRIPFKQKISDFFSKIKMWFLFTCLFTLLLISVIAVRETVLNTNIKEIKFIYSGTKIPQDEIKEKLNISKEDSLFGYDVNQAYENTKQIPYVKELKIKRKFPDSIIVYIEEKKEIAVFLEDEIHYPLDEDGEIIMQKVEEENLPSFITVEGYGAPVNFLSVFNYINKNKQLKDRFKKIIRIENRRFNLVTNDDKIIMLSSEQQLQALQKLSDLQKDYDILNKEFKKLDIRNSDKILIEL